MSLNDYSDAVAAARQHFEEGILRAGFVEKDGGWIGEIEHNSVTTSVTITLPSRFPFRPARVVPTEPDAVPWSWHRELDGALCLVAEDDHDNLWWVEADAFLEHTKAWLQSSDEAWVNDRTDLDLDRYFHASSKDTRLYLFGDLASLSNQRVRFDRTANNVMKMTGPGTKPRKSKGDSKRAYGFVLDVGPMVAPPRYWADISALADISFKLDEHIRDRSVAIVVVRYQRGDHEGVIVLEVWPDNTGGISARRLLAGADTSASRSARSGPNAARLKSKSVALIGAGALGSFVADGLARDGVDTMSIIDGDRILPGNLVRHLVGPESIGLVKSTAVKRCLERRYGPITVSATEADLAAADEAIELLEQFDLVINATADFAVTAMINAAAKAIGKHFLSAAIQNQGDTFRIDVLPSLDGSAAMRSTSRSDPDVIVPLYDSGCGSPISPTPPSSVIEAASATVRHAVGLLLSDPISAVGEFRELRMGSEPGQAE